MKRKHFLVTFVMFHLIRKKGLRLTFSISMGPDLSVHIVRKHFVEKIIERNISIDQQRVDIDQFTKGRKCLKCEFSEKGLLSIRKHF